MGMMKREVVSTLFDRHTTYLKNTAALNILKHLIETSVAEEVYSRRHFSLRIKFGCNENRRVSCLPSLRMAHRANVSMDGWGTCFSLVDSRLGPMSKSYVKAFYSREDKLQVRTKRANSSRIR